MCHREKKTSEKNKTPIKIAIVLKTHTKTVNLKHWPENCYHFILNAHQKDFFDASSHFRSKRESVPALHHEPIARSTQKKKRWPPKNNNNNLWIWNDIIVHSFFRHNWLHIQRSDGKKSIAHCFIVKVQVILLLISLNCLHCVPVNKRVNNTLFLGSSCILLPKWFLTTSSFAIKKAGLTLPTN